ncbi:MAG: BON domain-containing protein [Acidobacteria bacterium]|nr:BON domain-containing protein [Acidobacteriota bacterium]
MKCLLTALMTVLVLVMCGCNSQNTNEAANNASRKVSDAANTVVNKTREVAQNVNNSAGPTINDAAITTKIKTKLLADSITGTTVDTTNGVVTLTGSVASEEQKTKAEKHAQETEGVKSVKNELVIKTQ